MSATRSLRDLPGPRGLPLLGNAHQLLPMGRMHLKIEQRCERYGPIFRFRAGRRQWVAIADQETINRVLRDRPEGSRRLREIERSFQEIGFPGVFSVEGETWKRQRRRAGPRFCPRRNLASLEAKTALAMIARNFEIELDDSHGPVGEYFGFTMVPKGLRVRLRERVRTVVDSSLQGVADG